MDVYIIQHVEYEGPGAILPYLQKRGHKIHIVKPYAGDKIPNESDIDFAIMMGGPMSVLDEAKYPHFVREKELCRNLVQLNKPILGICLGAQMIASAFGAPIKKNRQKEIGWFKVTWNDNQPPPITAFHWHGETFDIPKQATPLAHSEACPNQAFRLKSALALQFHLEATSQSIANMLNNGAEEIKAGIATNEKYVQDIDDIQTSSVKFIENSNKLLYKILDSILEEK